MLQDDFPIPLSSRARRLERLSAVIFVVTILAAYVTTFISSDLYARRPGTFALLIGAGVLFVLLAEWFSRHAAMLQRPLIIGGYYLLQASLFGAILYFGEFNGFWLVALPIVGQAMIFGVRGGSIVAAFFFAVNVWVLALLVGGLGRALEISLSLLAAYIFVMLFSYIAVEAQRSQLKIAELAQELQNANQQLRNYAAAVEEHAVTQERNRIAREIHDTLGHYLTVINVQLEAAKTVLNSQPSTAKDAIGKAQQLTREGLADVRRSVSALRDSPIENRDISAAIADLVDASNAAGIATNLQIRGEPRPISPKTALTLYRTAQESLNNIRKHARASAADLLLEYDDGDQVRLTVADNGIGAADPAGGFGLMGIRERVQLLQGTFSIRSQPNQGFMLQITVPG